MAEQRVTESALIEAPVGEVYAFWSDLENLAALLPEVRGVRRTGPGTFRWAVRGPLGATLEFDARAARDEDNLVVAWSAEGGGVRDFFGEARFEEVAPDLTRVRLSVAPVATSRALREALRRFERVLERRKVTYQQRMPAESRSAPPTDPGDEPAVKAGRRVPGSFKGKLVPREDFDDPLPDDVLKGFGLPY